MDVEEENEEEGNDDVQTISDDDDVQNQNAVDQLQDKSNSQLLKRKHSSPGGEGSSKISNATASNDDEDGQLCPICFDAWTSNGPHRLTSLKCGHLFGYACVKRWLNTQFPYRCPTCNTKAKKSDLRFIYARRLVVVDNSEMVRLNETLEAEREAKRRAELDTASVRLLYQQVSDDNERLKVTIEELRRIQPANGSSAQNQTSTSKSANSHPDEINLLIFERKLNICEQAGQARVFAWEPRLGVVVTAVPSTNDLFPGFGVRKVSSVDWRPGQFVPIHSKLIKDLACKPRSFADGYLLSASMDGTVKVTSLSCNVPVANYSAQNQQGGPLPAWSCTWHSTSQFHFYAGYQNGTVRLYDIRRNDQHIREILPMGTLSPVVSLQHINRTSGNNALKGLVVGQLDRITFHEENSSDPADCQPHVLHMDGGLASLHFEPLTEHLLATFRPTSQTNRIRHNICTLDVTHLAGTRSVSLSVKQTVLGGRSMRLLSRSRLVPVGSSLYLIAGDEEAKSVCVWDIGADKLKQKVDLSQAVASDLLTIGGQQSAADSGKLLTLDENGKLSVFRLSPAQ